MGKKRVDRYIPRAYEALKQVEIAENNTIQSGFRRQIASFGAMIAMGSTLSAVALFSAENRASVNREKLMQAIYAIIMNTKDSIPKYALFEYVSNEIKKGNEVEVTEMIKDAAIAIKLAINLYEIKDEKPKKEEDNVAE